MREAEEQKPALRISHIVYGREKQGTRVYYLIDPQGSGAEKAVPETVVLTRWRKRRFPGHVSVTAGWAPICGAQFLWCFGTMPIKFAALTKSGENKPSIR